MSGAWFAFNGVSSDLYNMVVNNRSTFNAPKRKFETIKVPGRNGELIIDDGDYENIVLDYDCLIMSDFNAKMEQLRDAICPLRGYYRLEDSFSESEYRMASFSGEIVVDKAGGGKGRFVLSFNCKPQRFLKSGETAISVGTSQTKTIVNPTNYASKPRIVVAGTGTFSVSGRQCTVTQNNSTITIDSEIEDCYFGESVNGNSVVELVNGEFPVLNPGNNVIATPSTLSLSIIPNWYKV